MKTNIYSMLSHTCVWLAPHLRSLRANWPGEIQVCIIQGPFSDLPLRGGGTVGLSQDTADSLGVTLLEGPASLLKRSGAARQMRLCDFAAVHLAASDADYGLIVHGDAILERPTTPDALLGGRLAAARECQGHPWTTWVLLDARSRRPWTWADVDRSARVWPIQNLRSETLAAKIGPVDFAGHMEWCEPCWLHANAMSEDSPDTIHQKAAALRRYLGDWQDIPGKAFAPDPPLALPPRPSVLNRAGAYGVAVGRWIKAGRPTRSPERVLTIFQTHCQPCAYFNVHNQTCNQCGCRVRSSGAAFRNKLAMATESCPVGQWEAEPGA